MKSLYLFFLCSLSLLVAKPPAFLTEEQQGLIMEFETSFQQEVGKLLDMLDDEQRKKMVLLVDEKKDDGRWQIRYTGGKRLGLKLGELNDQQQAQFQRILKLVLSDYGYEMAYKVMAQDGEDAWRNYYIASFGDPRKNEDFAFLFGEHHLTLVWLNVVKGEVQEFGPILWGANPPTLWLEEEKDLMKLWSILTAAQKEKALIKNKSGIATHPIRANEGVPLTEIDPVVLSQIGKMIERRYSVFSFALGMKAKIISLKGGRDVRFAFYNEAPVKACRDGGRWDFKIGNQRVNADFENSRGHIHMSMWVKAQP